MAKSAKKAAKKKSTKPRQKRPVRRSKIKDEHGVHLTTHEIDWSIMLPELFYGAMREPPGTPQEKLAPGALNTTIPELRVMPMSKKAHAALVEALDAADDVQIKRLNPDNGPNLRWRIELAAAALATVIGHAYAAATGIESQDRSGLVEFAINLTVRRAREMYGQDGG